MFTPLTELFLIGLLVGLILGLVLGMFIASALARWHHAQAMQHLTQMAAVAARSQRPRSNPYDHRIHDEDVEDLLK